MEQLRAKLGPEAQASPAGLVVDSRLRVAGSGGSIIALGDAAVTRQVHRQQWQLDCSTLGSAEQGGGGAGVGRVDKPAALPLLCARCLLLLIHGRPPHAPAPSGGAAQVGRPRRGAVWPGGRRPRGQALHARGLCTAGAGTLQTLLIANRALTDASSVPQQPITAKPRPAPPQNESDTAHTLFVQAGRDFPQLGDLALQLDTGLFGAASRALFPNSEAAALAAKYACLSFLPSCCVAWSARLRWHIGSA